MPSKKIVIGRTIAAAQRDFQYYFLAHYLVLYSVRFQLGIWRCPPNFPRGSARELPENSGCHVENTPRKEESTGNCMADATGGIQEAPKERAEGAGEMLVWGCFAFLIGLKHVSAILSSRKTTLVDKNRRYVSLPTPRRRRVQKVRSCDLAFCENAATLLIGQHKSGSHIGDFCPRKRDIGEDGSGSVGGGPGVGRVVRVGRAVGWWRTGGPGAEGPEPRSRRPRTAQPRAPEDSTRPAAQPHPSPTTRPRAEGSSCDRKARPSRMLRAPCPP